MVHWANIYHERRVTAEEAVRAIKSGDRVFLTGNCSVPQVVLAALVEYAKENLHDVELTQVLTVGEAAYAEPEMEGHIRVNTMFIGHGVRRAVQEGRADFTPVFLSEVPRLYRTELPLDVALIHVSPPDEHGFCSFGVEVGVTKTAANVAKTVIAEVNPRMPRTLGDSFIHISKIDLLVEVDYPLPEFRMGEPSEVQQAIGQHIAGLIEDGSTIQTGIGGIPDAVLQYLDSKKDLGIHTELFSDGVIDLVNRGIINNEAKTLHPGKIIAGFLLGTQRLYDFVHDNPIVELHPTEYVNDPFLIAQNEKMVSINSAIEVDLTGQVCADSIGPSLYSGVGGQVDFVRGAARSKGGKPIIALPSTAKDDTISRITWQLRPGAGVVTTRNDVHYIVTEYGVAYLYGKSIRERAQALINIAHPNFREELERKARELNYIPRQYVGVGTGE
ncbi:MAG TPA: acetyl-CoA hydrolase/transferase C-terminal domain-containing protein [Aggregatilineales bacterium]|nr:acetyl-CoA hydrolase/transferase family protein [Chloroflexota bacterium]HOA25133.1 acetyl-CoA hydrolase/transferase C-terminal domain-containing protein [Aggregatilineales bacterium]HPV08428.1 acetyl-CoA hydrolase/transferase C-terminal domain-containing protein [Aggregatilineales bacterium]HQA67836.1 acetyl-CoA hydrolase/transferase C-terminal domain-containing protein [Aggregatilineales bacterium]HQE18215.1 acetyl-CoA hydrolase/transferase C-terminal domain-containing protein [Aggregatili